MTSIKVRWTHKSADFYPHMHTMLYLFGPAVLKNEETVLCLKSHHPMFRLKGEKKKFVFLDSMSEDHLQHGFTCNQ